MDFHKSNLMSPSQRFHIYQESLHIGAPQPRNNEERMEDSPLYVNPKQFHRIIKRRVARQGAEETLSNATRTEWAQDSEHESPRRSSISPFVEQKAKDAQEWPYNCKYVVPELIDANGAIHLLNGDAEFNPVDNKALDTVNVLDIMDSSTSFHSHHPSDSRFASLLRMSDLNLGDTRIIFVPQKRLYPKNGTFNRYEWKRLTWMRILSECDVPPAAVEVLHNNNGGWGFHTSYCSDVRGKTCIKTEDDLLGETLCARHIWLKPQHWWNEERFVYARYDFHSRKRFLLVTGTSLKDLPFHLSLQFEKLESRPHLFSVVLALVTSWSKDLERFLWVQDFATQKLESDTGWSTIGHTQIKPLPPDKLALRKDMMLTKEALSHTVRASVSLGELFIFLSKHAHDVPCDGLRPNVLPNQLEDAFLSHETIQRHQRGQAQGLIDRIDAQWNVVNALIAQHNNTLNYQIATDSRIDAIVMRRITFVTITFLPATFLATFFSMSFFQITSGHISVSPTIWIYVVCVIPLTLAIAWQSSTTGLSQLQWFVSKVWKWQKGNQDALPEDREKQAQT